MSTVVQEPTVGGPASAARRSGAARAVAELLYVTSGLSLGVVWFTVLVTLLAVGIGTAVVTIGVPLLALTLLLWRWGANTERERAALVLGTPIPHPPRPPLTGGLLARWRARVSDRATWKELAYLLLLLPVGVISGSVVVGAWSAALAAVAAPALSSSAPDQSLLGGLSPAALAGIAIGGLVIAALAVLITRALAAACAGLASALLAPDERALLAARVGALEATRRGAVESADGRLRRLERDLHDGAQHRLAFIAMELDRARAKLGRDPEGAAELLAGAHEESKRAMVELRDLVRGIHPSVLTDRGLDAAVSGLAERCPVPVDVDVALDARPPTAVEAAAYYVVAEALTNVGRHADARTAAVGVRREGERLVIEVRDDGHGGAQRTPGSGLEGLAQRVEALDGELVIDSPPGGPTTIKAELPCGS
jgi:signal transduction histidine kinase